MDAILAPTAPAPARKIGEFADDPLHEYLSDISVPCGESSGLPVGLQILGPHFGEAKLLRVARAAEPTS